MYPKVLKCSRPLARSMGYLSNVPGFHCCCTSRGQQNMISAITATRIPRGIAALPQQTIQIAPHPWAAKGIAVAIWAVALAIDVSRAPAEPPSSEIPFSPSRRARMHPLRTIGECPRVRWTYAGFVCAAIASMLLGRCPVPAGHPGIFADRRNKHSGVRGWRRAVGEALFILRHQFVSSAL